VIGCVLGISNGSYWIGSVGLPFLLYGAARIRRKNRDINNVEDSANDLNQPPSNNHNDDIEPPLRRQRRSYLDNTIPNKSTGMMYSGYGAAAGGGDDDLTTDNDCNDFILCLLENWISSVFATALLGITLLATTRRTLLTPLVPPFRSMGCGGSSIPAALASLSALSSSATSLSPLHNTAKFTTLLYTIQLVTRMASFASLHQYPELNYELQRRNQPRPIPLFPYIMQTAVNTITRIVPWGLACDLVQCMLSLLLTSVGVDTGACGALPARMQLGTKLPLRRLLPTMASLLLLLPPLLHLSAIKRILRVNYFTDLSLGTDYTIASRILDHTDDGNGDDGGGNWKWRWRLIWREPTRLPLAVRGLWRDFMLFLLTSGEDNVVGLDGDVNGAVGSRRGSKRGSRRQTDAGIEDDTLSVSSKLNLRPRWRRWGKYHNDDVPTSTAGDGEIIHINEEDDDVPKILALVREEMERYPNNRKPPPDRSTWIATSTARMSAIHQTNYETKDFVDPLGIAVQQTLGIGLSYDYDHGTKLKKGENPSIHRLRARAAKSAVTRYNQIKRDMDDANSTRDERDTKTTFTAEGSKVAVDAGRREIHYIANELLTLIPTNATSPEGKDVNIETLRLPSNTNLPTNNIGGSGSSNWIESQEKPADPWKARIRKEFGEDYVDDPYFNAEELFVQEFMRRRRLVLKGGRGNETKTAPNSEEEDATMSLLDDNGEDSYLA